MKRTIVNFRIGEKMLEQFKKVLRKEERNMSEIIRNFISDYIKKNESKDNG